MQIKGCDIREDTVLEIGRFAILWNWFEGSLCGNDCKPEVIRRVAKIVTADAYKQARLAETLNQRRDLFGQCAMEYIRASLHPRNARPSTDGDKQTMCVFFKKRGTMHSADAF